jgi:integrase
LKEITDATKAAKPKKRTQITLTNEERLAQFDDSVVLAQTLHLPEHLMKLAAALKAEGQVLQAAWLASVAVAVKIELHCPLRIHTLNELRLGKEVVKLGTSTQRYTHLLIGEDRTKTDTLVRWPMNASTSALIDDFVSHHRGALGGAASPYLFAARNHTDKPRDKSAMGTAITRAIKEHIGIIVNIHLFRAFAGVRILENNAAGIEDLRQILGHKTMVTAMQYYTSHQSQRSALRLNDRVTALVKQTRGTAAAAFSGAKGKARKPIRGSKP